MICAGCDRVGLEVPGGGSSGKSDAVVREGDAGVVGDSARAETSVGILWSVKTSKGTGEGATRRCLERRQVLNLGIPSRELIVGPETNRSKGSELSGVGGKSTM